jgi:predicted DNA repair protein MutK
VQEQSMSAGLFALLDDVAALARLAAASIDDVGAAAGRASTKAAGVVIDDTAVTPQYVRGLAAERELPIIRRIAKGSLRNKLLIILPVALLLSQFLPWLLTPVLMLGGAYLCYEAAEKIWHALTARFGSHGDVHAETHGAGGEVAERGTGQDVQPAEADPAKTEEEMVSGAIRTDLILSAEIMVISLNEVAAEGFWSRLAILTVVAIAITIAVYGVVALIVKIDDIGLYLSQRSKGAVGSIGRGMVKAMPAVLSVISVVGTAAMAWVGGHIELVGLDELGWHAPYDLVHSMEKSVHDALPALGEVGPWLTNTAASAVVGLLLGAVIVALMSLLPTRNGQKAGAAH